MKEYLKKTKMLMVVLFSIIVLPVYYGIVDAGLDPSWQYALNKFAFNHDYKFGRDINFTYGPLGFMCNPMSFNGGIWISLTILFVIFCGIVVLFYRIIRDKQNELILAGLILLLFGIPTETVDSFLQMCGVLVVLYIFNRRDDKLAWILYFFIFIISFYYKSSVGVAFIGCAFMCFLMDLILKRRIKLCCLFIPAVFLPFVYLFYNCSIKNFISYIRNSLFIAKEYSAAMSIVGPFYFYFMFVVLALVYVAGIIYFFKCGANINASIMIICMPVLFMAYKHGAVRCDEIHVKWALSECCSIVATLLFFINLDEEMKKGRKKVRLAISIIVFVLISVVTGIGKANIVDNFSYRCKGIYIIAADSLMEEANQLRLERIEGIPDSFVEMIADSTVTSLPWDISFIEKYDSISKNFVPIPYLQSYVAYSNELDKILADFFDDNGPEYIIFKYKSIDLRVPLLDTPTAWKSVVSNYDIALYDEDYNCYLLKRKIKDCDEKPKTEEKMNETFNHVIDVGKYTYVRIDSEMSLIGKIRGFLFNIPPVNVRITYENGLVKDGRVLMSSLKNGFDTCLIPYDYNSVPYAFNVVENSYKIKYIELYGNGTNCYSNEIMVYGY